MAGIKDVAKLAGVSVSTVSNVLNNKKNVGDETRRRVMEICEELSYYPNAAGKNLKNGDTKTILFNFSDFDRSFYLSIINGISDYAVDNGYDLMICTRKSCERFMRNGMTSGCIILDMRMKTEFIEEVASEKYPVVFLDRVVDHPYIKSIVVNNYAPMVELVQGLVDRGYKRFSFIGGPEATDDNKERYRAFIDVLNKNGLPFSGKNYHSGDFRQKTGYMAAKIMVLSDELPECIVCANDNMAIGAVQALHEAGLRVPEDVAVTGFDNCALAEPLGLTTVDIPNYERGYLAAQYLIENIEGGQERETLKINAKVRWRKTVSKKRADALMK